jgi:hypothetical protein
MRHLKEMDEAESARYKSCFVPAVAAVFGGCADRARRLTANSSVFLKRWKVLLLKDDTASLCAVLSVAAAFGLVRHGTDNCLAHVALVVALQLGLLAVLDFRDWVHRQVSREAAKVDPSLMVSCSLELSSLDLQEQYYKWMDQIPAVRWQPLAILVADVAFLLSPVISKLEGGCNWRVENGRG